MITQIWSQIHPWTIRSEFAVTRAESLPTTPQVPRIEPRHSHTGDRGPLRGLASLTARWRARDRSHAELDELTDALRADVGLAPKPPRRQHELRFIAKPDQFRIFEPESWG